MTLLEGLLWLTLNVYHEARSEPQIGQVAVAHVTLNRASEKRLPVKEIIKQPYQFSWHFYPKWEHLLAGSTQTKSDWPFAEPGGNRRVVYDPKAMPKSADLLDRTLVYPISIRMSETQLQDMEIAIKKASEV